MNAGEPIKILVVDDDEDDMALTLEVLRDDLLVVNPIGTARHGDEAIDLLDAGERFDLVLLDIRMPRRNGHETLAWIRGHEDDTISATPVIMLTSSDDPQDIREAWQGRVSGYVPKGDATNLIAAVKQIRTFFAVWVKAPPREEV